MSDTSGTLAADREFFKAVTDGNRDGLNWLLADDFILIDNWLSYPALSSHLLNRRCRSPR